MKKVLLFTVLLAFGGFLFSQIQTPRVYVSDFKFGDMGIEIDYGFENCNPSDKFVVWFEAITKGGEKFTAKTMFGGNVLVSPQKNLKAIWLTGKDAVIINEEATIKVYAAAMPKTNMTKAYIASSFFPGLGHKAAGGKNNKLYLGAVAYAGLAGGLYFNNKASENYDAYQNEFNPTKAGEFLDQARSQRMLALTSAGFALAMWGLDYFLLSKTKKRISKITPVQIQSDPYTKPYLIAESQQKFINTRGFPPNLFAELAFNDDNGNGILEAEENAELSIKIINNGEGNAYDLKINIKDNNPDASFKYLNPEIIDILKPNKAKTINIPINTDIELKTLEHKLQIDVMEKFGYDMDPAFLVLQTYAYQPAVLTFSGFEILDAGPGTSAIVEDGLLQPGEMVKVKLVFQNTGQGVAENTNFNIQTNDKNYLIRDYSGSLGNMQPGEVKEVYMTLSPNKRVDTKGDLPLFLTMDEKRNRGNLENYQLPIKMNQKPPQTNIVTLNKDIESLKKNIARFEYSSKKFSAKAANLANIRSVIPSQTKRAKSIGVVFGVQNYENMAQAPYADKDAEIMKDYFEKVLGVEQVISFINKDVTIANFHKVFNPDYGQLKKAVVPGETEVFVFYSGHGVPDKSGNNVYLFPYDGIKEDLITFGYNITDLYENLNKLGAKSVTVILDACFSGSSRKSETIKEENLIAHKGNLTIKVTKPWVQNSNFNMISSSTGSETSLGLDDSETGLFTYYLCAGLQGKADKNEDRKITMGELKNYVIENVKSHSQKISGVQTPEFNVNNEDLILTEY